MHIRTECGGVCGLAMGTLRSARLDSAHAHPVTERTWTCEALYTTQSCITREISTFSSPGDWMS